MHGRPRGWQHGHVVAAEALKAMRCSEPHWLWDAMNFPVSFGKCLKMQPVQVFKHTRRKLPEGGPRGKQFSFRPPLQAVKCKEIAPPIDKKHVTHNLHPAVASAATARRRQEKGPTAVVGKAAKSTNDNPRGGRMPLQS